MVSFLQRYKVTLSYDGRPYCGWQRQVQGDGSDLPSVQFFLEQAIHKVTQEKVNVVGSGRTDSGVHASGQVAHFSIETDRYSEGILQKALNSQLPEEIRVLDLNKVEECFHAQRSAVDKQYSYYILQGANSVPHLHGLTHWEGRKLDFELMHEAAKKLVGEFDFGAFQASGGEQTNTVRTIFESEVTRSWIDFPDSSAWSPRVDSKFYLLRYRVVGSGFLKQMVRGIVGTLIQVGLHERSPECFEEILKTGDRELVGPTAKGYGLWLEKVSYEPKSD